MADYPVKNGLGQNIVTGYDVDDEPPAYFYPPPAYPVLDGLGQAIIETTSTPTWSPPERIDGYNVVDRYPVLDGLGNTIVAVKFHEPI